VNSNNGNVVTYSDRAGIEDAYPVVTNNSAQSIYHSDVSQRNFWNYGVQRTGNAKDGTILEFVCDGILDFMIRFVIHRSCFQAAVRASIVLYNKILIPVASSRMMILEFLTSARARDTRERWNFQ